MNRLRYDHNDLARTSDDTITLYRRVASPELKDITAPARNDIHASSARTLFHGIEGVYGGNTPESLAMLKHILPHLMRFEVPANTTIDDQRRISNTRWAGRHALALAMRLKAAPADSLTIVRLTPPASLLSRRYRHPSEQGIVGPAWVITPPALFAEAPKEIIDE